MSGKAAIQNKYNELKKSGLDLGSPQFPCPQDAGFGGLLQVYERGRIYWHTNTGVHEVHGGILEKYLSMQGPGINPESGNRDLGFPTTDELESWNGCPYSEFEWGAIYWSGVPGGACIHGDIYHAWKFIYGGDSDVKSMACPISDHIKKCSGGEVVYCQFGALWQGADTDGQVVGFWLRPPLLGRPKIFNPSSNDERTFDMIIWAVSSHGYNMAQTHNNFPGLIDAVWGNVLRLVSVAKAGDHPDIVPLYLHTPSWTKGTSDGMQENGHVILEVPSELSLRDRTLYSLSLALPGGTLYELMPHAFYTKTSWDNFGFIHITDLHISRRLEGFRNKLQQAGCVEGAQNLVNTNDSFRSLINYANKLHKSGQIDFILATGDVVDYLFEEDDNYKQGGNWSFFRDLVKGDVISREGFSTDPLRVPIFTTMGNHDYRKNPYPLRFVLDLPFVIPDKTVSNFTDFNITADEAIQLQDGKTPKIKIGELLHTVLDNDLNNQARSRDWYNLWINDESSYMIRLGPHRIVMLNSGHETDIPGNVGSALWAYLFGSEDQRNAIRTNPPSAGLNPKDIRLLGKALSQTSNGGLVVVGMHAPVFNLYNSENPHYFRETEHPTADSREIKGFIKRHSSSDPDVKSKADEFKKWWSDKGAYFKRGSTDPLLDYGTVKMRRDEFLRICLGIGTQRKADLILYGHKHARSEFRLGWDPHRQEILFYTDFYTENPVDYYKSCKVGYKDPVGIIVSSKAPLGGRVAVIRDHRRETFWEESSILEVPPYINPLNSAQDKLVWWEQHRPLFLQTASLGTIDMYQRKDKSINKTFPVPPFQGCRVISVTNNIITSIQYKTMGEMKSVCEF